MACFFQSFASNNYNLQSNIEMVSEIEDMNTEVKGENIAADATDDDLAAEEDTDTKENHDKPSEVKSESSDIKSESPKIKSESTEKKLESSEIKSEIQTNEMESKDEAVIDSQMKDGIDSDSKVENHTESIPDSPSKRTPTKEKKPQDPNTPLNQDPQTESQTTSPTVPAKSMLTRTNTGAIKHHEHKKDNKTSENGEPPKKRRKKKLPVPDELLKCEVCGVFGMTSEFCASGRFCSQRCVGAHASKCRADALALAAANAAELAATVGVESGEAMNEAKKKKKKKKKKKPAGKKKFSKTTDSTGNQYGMGDDGDYHDNTVSNYKGSNQSKMTRTDYNSNKVVDDDSMVFYNAVQYSNKFDWELYLKVTKSTKVPVETFSKENPFNVVFPQPACGFQPRMKLEAIDPKHQSCLCVVSVVEVKGCRLRLHFDGWSESYDFWTNADSPFLFYAGWAAKYNQNLNPPRGVMKTDFNWNMYLANNKAYAAPKSLFRKIHPSKHGFEVGMKLEAVDRKNPDLTCVASITNIIGEYLLVHFDNWDDTYDYWCQNDCPYIHPIGWCDSVGLKIIPPQDDQINTFRWDEYLQLTGSKAASSELFVERSLSSFVVGQKLEAIDPRNASLARIGTVAEIEDYRVKIHFDGWDHMYDFWFDTDSTDIHPVGWCEHTGHPLEPPPSPYKRQDPALCPTRGCRGIGHVKGAKYTSHHSIFGCPYSCQNLERGSPLVDRLASNSMGEEPSLAVRIHKTSSTQERSSDDMEEEPQGATIPVARSVGRPMKRNNSLYKSSKLQAAQAIKSKYTNGGTNGWNGNEEHNKQADHFTPNGQITYNGTNGTLKHVVYGNVTSSSGQVTRYRKSEEQKDSPANSWTVKDVTEFILNVSAQEHASCFEEQQIDGEALLLLSQGDMIRHLGIKLGPALKIYNEIRKL